MLLGRFSYERESFYGIVEGSKVYELDDPYNDYELSSKSFNLSELEILPPCEPTKIVCVGLNYRDHAEEFNLSIPEEPLLFLKPPSSITSTLRPVIYPEMAQQLDFEGELAIVIKKEVQDIAEESAGNYILGYTCANDITARDLQKIDGQWIRAKSFDTFLPLGPYICTNMNPSNSNISVYVNGKIKQQSSTQNLIFNVYQLVSYISKIMTLKSGDVILTGTPSGVGPLNIGDKVKVCINNIGALENYIKAR